MNWIDFLITAALETLGRPITLERFLQEHSATRVAALSDPEDIAEASIPRWNDFGQTHSRFPLRRRGEMVSWFYSRSYGYVSTTLQLAELTSLAMCSTSGADGIYLDLQDVAGFCHSKSDLTKLSSLDDMAVRCCEKFIANVSEEGLATNLAHNECRIMRPLGQQGGDHFIHYAWDGRYMLANSGGSHHLAAARYIAAQINRRVPLHGRLYHYSLRTAAIESLTQRFAIVAMSDAPKVTVDFHDAMTAYEAPYAWLEMPRPYRDLRAILLPRDSKRATRVADMLLKGGYFDVGGHLKMIASTSRKPRDFDKLRKVEVYDG